MPISLLKVEDSLTRVRAGLESRARRIEGRVGQELAAHISRPGKMLRSRFALLMAGSLGVDQEKAEGVSRAMELVHNASLLHDDCVDEADLRRGHPTPNKIFGTTVGLLLGDLAFAQGLDGELAIIDHMGSQQLHRIVAAPPEADAAASGSPAGRASDG